MSVHSAWNLLLAAAALFAGAAAAAGPAARAPDRPAVDGLAVPVGDALLARARGGFDLGNGLVASFGISRIVYVNGALVASATVNIPDFSRIDASQAAALAALGGAAILVHDGPGNFVDPGAFRNAIGATVIQNTLDDQQIRAVTTLDATVRNLSLYNAMNLASGLQQAMILTRGQ